jgi:hypothetical protein
VSGEVWPGPAGSGRVGTWNGSGLPGPPVREIRRGHADQRVGDVRKTGNGIGATIRFSLPGQGHSGIWGCWRRVRDRMPACNCSGGRLRLLVIRTIKETECLHGPEGTDWTAPGSLEAVISGKVGVHGITEGASRGAAGTRGGDGLRAAGGERELAWLDRNFSEVSRVVQRRQDACPPFSREVDVAAVPSLNSRRSTWSPTTAAPATTGRQFPCYDSGSIPCSGSFRRARSHLRRTRHAARAHRRCQRAQCGDPVVIRRRLLRSKEAGQPEELGTSYIPAAIAAGSYLEEPAARAPQHDWTPTGNSPPRSRCRRT